MTLSDIYYFWFAPSLTYQIAYPRLAKRDWFRIFTLIARLFLSNVLIIFLVAQVVSPNLKELTKDLESGKHVFSVEIFAEYLLKLAIASTYIWLLVFYSYFHLFFNILFPCFVQTYKSEASVFGNLLLSFCWLQDVFRTRSKKNHIH